MFTQCPNCRQIQSLTVEQLRNSRAIVHCSHCAILFDALELLSETAPEQAIKTQLPPDFSWDIPRARRNKTHQDLPWEKPAPRGKTYWRTGVLLSLLLLIGQAAYFEAYTLSQKPKLRPVLEKLCRTLACRLPAYKNLDELTVLHGSLNPLPDQQYEFRAIVTNQAVVTQAYPNINLILLDYTGKPFTRRIFQPRDYLPEQPATTAMPKGASVDINLKIAATQTRIGGYTFELTY